MELQKLLDQSKAKLDTVHPTLRDMGNELIKKSYAEGIYIIITQGLRTIEYQNQLYSQGRKLVNGVWKVVDKNKVVTNAKGGTSFHNYGLAIDFAVLDSNGSINWNVDKRWKRVGAIGESLGADWGGSWTSFLDIPHFQMTFGLSISDLKAGKKPPVQKPVVETPKPVSKPVVKPVVVPVTTPQEPTKELKKVDAKTLDSAREAIDTLASKGLLSDPEYWKGKLEESLPVWAWVIVESRKVK